MQCRGWSKAKFTWLPAVPSHFCTQLGGNVRQMHKSVYRELVFSKMHLVSQLGLTYMGIREVIGKRLQEIVRTSTKVNTRTAIKVMRNATEYIF